MQQLKVEHENTKINRREGKGRVLAILEYRICNKIWYVEGH